MPGKDSGPGVSLQDSGSGGSPSAVPRPAGPAGQGNLGEMGILRPHPRPLVSKALQVRPRLGVHEPSRCSRCVLEFESHTPKSQCLTLLTADSQLPGLPAVSLACLHRGERWVVFELGPSSTESLA